MDEKEFGKISEKVEKLQIEWRIEEFFSVSASLDSLNSPTFFFTESAFHLRMWTHCKNFKNYIGVFLVSDARDHPVEYNFGWKKRDSSVEPLCSGILKKKGKCSPEHSIIEKSELENRSLELMAGNTFTIICTLSFVTANISNSTQKTGKEKGKSFDLIKLNKLSEDFKSLLDDKESCDVTLKVQEKEFRAHRTVLMARSSVLAANFKHDTLENQTSVIMIPDCDPATFGKFLEYLYCGKLGDLSLCNAINLYYTSDKYDVKEIKEFCAEYILQCLYIENVCDIAVLADKYDDTQLLSAVHDFFIKNYCKVLLTSEWESLMKTNYRLASKLLREMAKLSIKE